MRSHVDAHFNKDFESILWLDFNLFTSKMIWIWSEMSALKSCLDYLKIVYGHISHEIIYWFKNECAYRFIDNRMIVAFSGDNSTIMSQHTFHFNTVCIRHFFSFSVFVVFSYLIDDFFSFERKSLIEVQVTQIHWH